MIQEKSQNPLINFLKSSKNYNIYSSFMDFMMIRLNLNDD